MKKSMSKYEVIIYWNKDDQAFIAEAQELAGCTLMGPRTKKRWQTWKPSSGDGSKQPRNSAAQFQNPRPVWRSLDLAHR
jgi:hypothetical protein